MENKEKWEAIYGITVQLLPGLETKRYKRLRRIIANTGDFTG